MTAHLNYLQLGGIIADESGWFCAFADAFSEMRDQRDSARRWAVREEQQATEYERRVTVALILLDTAACECSRHRGTSPLVCVKHSVEDVLRTGSLP